MRRILNGIISRTWLLVSMAAALSGLVGSAHAAETTVTFSSTATNAWSDGIADDGDGGSINISGKVIQFSCISDTNGTHLNKPLIHGNFSTSDSFNALTTYDLSVNAAGFKGMKIRSQDGSEFQLNGFYYANWGAGSAVAMTVKGYRNGNEVASTNFTSAIDGTGFHAKTVSLDYTFDSVDEVRVYSTTGTSWHGLNSVKIDDAVVRPPGQAVTPSHSVFVRPGGISAYWSYAYGTTPDPVYPGTYPVASIKYYDVSGAGYLLTRGRFEYSSNGGSTWTTHVNNQDFVNNYISVPGTVWRFVDTSPSDTINNNSVGVSWTLQGIASSISSGSTVYPDNAPTDVSARGFDIWATPSVGDDIALLTKTDTGLSSGGLYQIDSQSVPNLFTISASSNGLARGTGTVPAAGQTATVTVRYFDHLQLDSISMPIAGQGVARTLTYTVRANPVGFGNDIHVNTYTNNAQSNPVVTKLSNGNFVSVWRSLGQGGESTTVGGIYGQIYSASGTAVGSEFAISPAGLGTNELTPSVAALNAGRFVVAYGKTVASSDNDIVFRIVEANGTLGSEVVAATSSTGSQVNPTVATLTNGNFVVAWASPNGADTGDIFARCFTSSGTAVVGSQVTVNSTTSGLQNFPTVDALSDGNYAVTWRDPANSGDIMARVMSASGSVSSQISVSSTTNTQTTPRIAGLSGDGFVVVWQETARTEGSITDTTSQANIYGQRYNNAGVAQGSILLVNGGTSGNQINASAVGLSGGGFIVVWSSDTDGDGTTGIFGRRFNSSGTATDDYDFQVNQLRPNAQSTPMVTALTSDSFASIWADAAIDGPSNSGIQTRIFTAAASAPEIAVSGNATDIPNGDASPTSTDNTDFGSVSVASGTVVRTFTITNSGSASLTLGGSPLVVVSGANAADFSVTAQPTSPVAASGSTTFNVTFDPSASGTRSATLSITNNDSDEGVFTFAIQGTGSVAAPTDISLSNSSVNQSSGANATVGTLTSTDTDSSSFTYTLVAGTGSTDNSSFNISGATLRANNASALAAGSYSVRVRTDDGTGGTFEEAFSINVVDNVAPTVSSVAAPANATYKTGQNLDFTVTFSEAVNVVGTPKVNLTVGASARTADYVSGSSSTALVFRYTVPSGDEDTDGVAVGTLVLSGGTIRDAALNAATLTLNSVGSTTSVRVDGVVPAITSINRASPSPTNGTAVSFTVTFGESVTGVDASDFTVTATGTAGGSVASVTGSGTSYTVTVNSITGDGTLRLDLKASGTGIADTAGNAIATGYTSGQTFTFDHTAPTISSINRVSSSPSTATSVDFTVTFGESVTGVDASDFTVTATGTAGGSVASVTGSGTTYTVTVNSITGTGTLRLDLKGSGTGIADSVGNAVSGGFTSGQTYSVSPSNSAPTDIALSASSVNQSAGANAVVGTLSATDADSGDTHAFTLVAGTGSTDNASFNISGTSLRANNAANLTAGSYSVRVRVTDSGNTTFEKTFSITVQPDEFTIGGAGYDVFQFVTNGSAQMSKDALEVGTGNPVTVTFGSVPIGTTTGAFVAAQSGLYGEEEPDSSGNVYFVPTATTNYNDNASFIVQSTTHSFDLADFSYYVALQTVGVPVTLTVQGYYNGTLVDTASTVIQSSTLGTAAAFLGSKFTGSGKQVNRVIISADDAGSSAIYFALNQFDLDQFTPLVLNHAPTDIALSNSSVNQSAGANAVVGTLSATDADSGDTHTFTLVAGTGSTDNASFNISGTSLRANNAANLAAGSYSVRVRATDSGTATFEKAFTVTVTDDVAPVITSAGSASATNGTAFAYTITATGDATVFGANGLPSGLSVTSGSGLISGTPTQAGSFNAQVIATDAAGNSVTNALTLTVTKGAAAVTLASLNHTFDGTGKAASATTAPSGLTVVFSYDGGAVLPTNAGTYVVVGTVDDTNYTGSATNSLVIGKASAAITLAGLSHVFDGTGKAATATTTPSGLAVVFTYDGGAALPTNAGSYVVIGTVNDTNYAGSATNNMVISKATASVTLAGLSHVYDGTGKAASASTTPSGLPVTFTYEGGAVLPTNAGSYVVIGTINDTNYAGSATNNLVIGKASASITLASLSHVFDGAGKAATATTTPNGLPVTFSYDGGAVLPTNAGSYVVVGTINDTNYVGSATNNLVIGKASALITLASLSHVYDGTGKAATASTTPTGLPITFTYDGSAVLPTNGGSYVVVGTVNDTNYSGSATNSLVISLPAPLIALSRGTNFYTLGDQPTALDALASFSAPGNRPFNGGTLGVTIVSNIGPKDLLWLADQASGTNRISASGNEIRFDGTAIATYSGGTTGAPSIDFSFNANASESSVRELLRNVAFGIGEKDATNLLRVVALNFADGTGATSAPVSLALVLNHRPRLSIDRAVTGTNLPVFISYTRVLTNDTDIDADTLRVWSIPATSVSGATLATNATGILYTPVNGFSGDDQFAYTVDDGRGGRATATVTVIVLDRERLAIEDAPFEPAAVDYSATVGVTGIPTRAYRLQASQDLILWTTLGTVTPDDSGLVKFRDTDSTNHVHRFYRTVYP